MNNPISQQSQQSAPSQQTSVEQHSLDPSFKQIYEIWTQSQADQKNLRRDFETNVRGLHNEILKEWKKANEPSIGPATKKAFFSKLEKFLINNESNNRIDDCVLWVILCRAASNEEKEDKGTEVEIIKTILQRRPHLAFANVHMASMTSSCEFKGDHSNCPDLKNNKSSPLHDAASANNAVALQCFIDGIKKYCDNVRKEPNDLRKYTDWLKLDVTSMDPEALQLRIVQAVLPRGHMTALALAADADGDGEALEYLLTAVPNIVDENDDTFKGVVEKGKVNIVGKFLKHSRAHELFARSQHIIEAIDLVPSLEDPERNSRLDIVRDLIKIAKGKSPQYFDPGVAGAIIKKELLGVWEAIAGGVSNLPCFVLHQAVQYGKLIFVQRFLKEHPHFVLQKHGLPTSDKAGKTEAAIGHYPLWYNNMNWQNYEWEVRAWPLDEERAAIRSEVITHTVRQVGRMNFLSDILAESGEPARELCFDLSHINFKLDRVSEFAQSLINHREGEELFQYEETLKYADFPVLDINPDDRDEIQLNSSLPIERREIFEILNWLKDKKEVKRIFSLKVPDRLINPHDEVEIANQVDLFMVEILDWRLLDMSISIFSSEAKDRLTELSLYASGKRSVISHWLSNEGIPSLHNLQKLQIYVVKETGDAKSYSKTANYILTEFSNKAKAKAFTKLEFINISVESQFWNPVHRMENLDEIAKRVAPKLSQFIEGYRKYAFERTKRAYENTQSVDENAQKVTPFRATKVAIIDNGILGISRSLRKLPEDGSLAQGVDATPSDSRAENTPMTREELYAYFMGKKSVASRIKGGRSFVDESYKLSPWFFASNPHGTQMANLICAMDPLCELYVAKVHDGQYGMTAGRVARAIKWAVAQEVDVISMSFTIINNEEKDELKEALNLAGQKGIAILCSVHDEGTKVDHAWPASHQGDYMIVVAACDEYGRILREMDEKKYSFMLNGKNVAAGVIPFLEPNERITGSSVATALAAGLSSLTLACDRLVDPKEKIHKTNNRGLAPSIKERFRDMQPTGPTKYVVLDKFAGIDRNTQPSQADTMETVFKRWPNAWQRIQ